MHMHPSKGVFWEVIASISQAVGITCLASSLDLAAFDSKMLGVVGETQEYVWRAPTLVPLAVENTAGPPTGGASESGEQLSLSLEDEEGDDHEPGWSPPSPRSHPLPGVFFLCPPVPPPVPCTPVPLSPRAPCSPSAPLLAVAPPAPSSSGCLLVSASSAPSSSLAGAPPVAPPSTLPSALPAAPSRCGSSPGLLAGFFNSESGQSSLVCAYNTHMWS
ncbi:hypothetical protein DSO57_1006850 [Entomophthora muscae]|uniref:Uncharacterized protein n=1 Tax=Entomophthora muscae TaxID=34485 RepID=A0ACC2SK59_9FUNG|nr:hypothetical protein DSO57_1006850 [Entomophthora muscae]